MEKQETEMKRKLEMETGIGNWKLETEMGTKKNTNHWCNDFFIMCLVIIVVFYFSKQWLYDWLYESCALPLLLYCAS